MRVGNTCVLTAGGLKRPAERAGHQAVPAAAQQLLTLRCGGQHAQQHALQRLRSRRPAARSLWRNAKAGEQLGGDGRVRLAVHIPRADCRWWASRERGRGSVRGYQQPSCVCICWLYPGPRAVSRSSRAEHSTAQHRNHRSRRSPARSSSCTTQLDGSPSTHVQRTLNTRHQRSTTAVAVRSPARSSSSTTRAEPRPLTHTQRTLNTRHQRSTTAVAVRSPARSSSSTTRLTQTHITLKLTCSKPPQHCYSQSPTGALQQLHDAGLVKRHLPLNLLLLRQRHLCSSSAVAGSCRCGFGTGQ